MGCAIGGSPHPAMDLAIRALSPFSGERTASVLGRSERLDPLHASLMNGISSHVEDYDDTTPKNYSHTTSPVASALFAYASANPVRGRDFVEAFILGFEAASRCGNAVYPSHYDVGWHMTGTIGVFGAAAAIGKLEGLTTPADGVGARPGRDPVGRPARDVRLDGQGLPSRAIGAERLRRGDARQGGVHRRRARYRGSARLRARDGGVARSVEGDDAPRRGFRSAREHLQAVPVRHRQSPDHRRRDSDSRRASARSGVDRRRAPARGAAGARPVQPAEHHARVCRESSRCITAPRSGSCAARAACASTPTRP